MPEKFYDKKAFRKLLASLYTNEGISIIWGFVISMVTLTFLDETPSFIISTCLTLLVCLSTAYNYCFQRGFRDRNTCHMNQLQQDPLLGLKAGLWAAVPHVFVMTVYLIALYLVPVIFPVTNVIARIWFMPYLALFHNFAETVPYIVFPIILVIQPFFCWLGYLLGMKDIRIWEKIVYTNPNSKRAKKQRAQQTR